LENLVALSPKDHHTQHEAYRERIRYLESEVQRLMTAFSELIASSDAEAIRKALASGALSGEEGQIAARTLERIALQASVPEEPPSIEAPAEEPSEPEAEEPAAAQDSEPEPKAEPSRARRSSPAGRGTKGRTR
jgi:hypothetical protein